MGAQSWISFGVIQDQLIQLWTPIKVPIIREENKLAR